jgi:hypothetical protein
VLLWELGRNAVRMADPLYESPSPSESRSVRRRLSGRRGPVINPKNVGTPGSEEFVRAWNDAACALADLRQTVLWSSVYASSVLIGLVLTVLSLTLKTIERPGLIGLLVLFFLAIQVPYVIGQARLHGELLKPFEGVRRADVREQLNKYAPVFPKFQSLTALTTTGTAGGLLYLMLDSLAKNLLGLSR